MGKYAIVSNGVVVAIKEFETDDEIREQAATGEMIIGIDDLDPQPKVNWVLNGNQLEMPCGQSSREEFEIALATKKTDFGIALARTAIDRIGARNKILGKTGAQVSVLMSQLLSVKLLLETGALGTARYACSQLKTSFTEYADIFDIIITKINQFEKENGL
jgi:hypothetical protein